MKPQRIPPTIANLVPQWIAGLTYALVCLITGLIETTRWADPEQRKEALTGWMAGPTADWFPFAPLLILVVLCSAIRSPRRRNTDKKSKLAIWLSQSARDQSRSLSAWGTALLIGGLAFVVARQAEAPYSELPPAYHDEFSYLFQAETYLQGRLAFPSHPTHPELFDQVHVLNEGMFASRYFPGVGAWIAPFLGMGDAHLGHQIAQAIATFLIFWIGRELSSNQVGILAGVLFALSPGMILFSTLLLSHHPTLVGLLMFLWAFLYWVRTANLAVLFLSGIGLAFAMLCRPMTAAGFGLPFGIFFLYWWITGRPTHDQPATTVATTETQEIKKIVDKHFRHEEQERPPVTPTLQRTVAAIVLGLPLLFGFGVLLKTQQAITGSALTSPYQLYTDTYTPRHRYGFNNVVIGEQHLGPKVLDNYDRWAENLTPELALKNAGTRLVTSMRWTLGIVPLMLAVIPVLLTPRLGSLRWLLIVASIMTLHLAHIPYWFTGIMNWHYVLETAPLWLLLFAEGSSRLDRTWAAEGMLGIRLWWRALIITAILVNLVTIPPLWPGRLPQGLAETAFSRRIYDHFRQSIEELRTGQDAIVFVIPDPTDRHIDYISNPPSLTGPVLVAKVDSLTQAKERASLFPDRVAIVFNASHRSWERLNGSDVKQ